MIPVTQCDCMPEKQEFTEMVMIEPEELERLRAQVRERDRLRSTVKDLSGAMLSVNRSRNQKIMIEGDDEPCYWQREEWVKWIVELANGARESIQ